MLCAHQRPYTGCAHRHFPHHRKQTHFWESNLRHLRLAGVPVEMLAHYTNLPSQFHTVTYSVRIRPCLLHVRIADRIKNGGPYRCLVLTRVFLASKTSLSIADHLRATFINSSTCQAYIETLKMPLTHKQPKKWWTNKQTDRPNTLPLLRMRTHGVKIQV